MALYYTLGILLAVVAAAATGLYVAKDKEDFGTGGVYGSFSLLFYIGLVLLIGFFLR